MSFLNYNFTTYMIVYSLMFLIYFVIYYKMSSKNIEEWRYTRYDQALLIGGIIGFPSGMLLGFLLFGWIGFYLVSVFGCLISCLSMTLDLFIFNIIQKKNKSKEEIYDKSTPNYKKKKR